MSPFRQITVHAMTAATQGIANELVSKIRIGPAYKIGEKPPATLKEDYIAIWDTGATATAITKALADKLKLEQVGTVYSCGVTGTAQCRSFLVSLHLPNGVSIPELKVSDLEGDIGGDVLVGMDVISKGDFAVSNYEGNTSFTFRIPSLEKIDFTIQRPRQYIAKSNKIERNSLCPCGSGKKYKKCCGKPE